MPIARYDARLLPKQLTAAPGGSGLASRPALILPECKAACHAARHTRSGPGSAFRPAYIARCAARLPPRQLTAVRGSFRLASRPARISQECKALRACHTRGPPSSRRLRLGLPACPYNALRWEDRCPGSSSPHDAAPGWPLGPALTLLERSGLGAAFRHAYIDSSPRSKAAAQAAHRRARRPRARLSAGPYTLLECKAVTTRLAKLSGLGLWPPGLPIARCDARLLPRQLTAVRG